MVFFYILKAKKIPGSSPMIFSCQKHGLLNLPSVFENSNSCLSMVHVVNDY